MIVPKSVVDVPFSKLTVLPVLIVGLFVEPLRVAVPLFWMVPPLEVVSVPPVIVLPLKSTTELVPVDRIRPVEVLLKVPPVSWSVPPAVASSVPLLETGLDGAIWSAAADWLASIVPLLVKVKAKPGLLMPICPEPWIVLLASLVNESVPPLMP